MLEHVKFPCHDLTCARSVVSLASTHEVPLPLKLRYVFVKYNPFDHIILHIAFINFSSLVGSNISINVLPTILSRITDNSFIVR